MVMFLPGHWKTTIPAKVEFVVFTMIPTCRVMIANPAAAGEGISLHRACQYAIYLDRTFNAAHFLQSVDRIHRLGSDRPSRIDVLQATGTIDINIQQRLSTKIVAMSQILNDEGLRALAYDPKTLKRSLTAGLTSMILRRSLII